MDTKEIATKNGAKEAQKEISTLTVGKTFSLTPTSLTEAMSLAKMISESDLAPKDFKGKAGNCLIAMQMGMEVGLAPMQAIQNIAVINGRPTLWGDAALALVLASPVCEYVRESWDEAKQTWTCRSKRRDAKEESIYTFSAADADKAGLTKKEGTWQNYKKRMIQMRARAFNLRDTFADVLKGLAIREEVEDYIETTATATISTPVMTPKPMETAAPTVDSDPVLLPGELSFFTKKLLSMGADLAEVVGYAKTKYGVEDVNLLKKSQAKAILEVWEGTPGN